MYHNSLGFALWNRFERAGEIKDLDRAIESMEKAVVSTPVDHVNHTTYLNNLGTTLLSRFDTMGSMEDLDHAIETRELSN